MSLAPLTPLEERLEDVQEEEVLRKAGSAPRTPSILEGLHREEAKASAPIYVADSPLEDTVPDSPFADTVPDSPFPDKLTHSPFRVKVPESRPEETIPYARAPPSTQALSLSLREHVEKPGRKVRRIAREKPEEHTLSEVLRAWSCPFAFLKRSRARAAVRSQYLAHPSRPPLKQRHKRRRNMDSANITGHRASPSTCPSPPGSSLLTSA